ncbi:CBS domain protein [delta proteobacterium NaphS2]|nr:CBS domain protein [delta proteobacterium NaphS2]
MQIRDLLTDVGHKPLRIDGFQTLKDAVLTMTEQNQSALIVMDGRKTVGIITERDILRSYVKHGDLPLSKIQVKDVMTEKLIVAKSDDEIDVTISLMRQAGIRHLPVLEAGEIISLLNICDLAHYQAGNLSAELHYLEEYVDDLHEAGRD